MIVMVQVSISIRLGSPAMANVEQSAIVFVLQQKIQSLENCRMLNVQNSGHQFVSCRKLMKIIVNSDRNDTSISRFFVSLFGP